MKLIWTRRARHDLREIVSYIAEDNAEAAERVHNQIVDAAN
jgi:plasmid stabilization system protein ParE